MSLEHLPTPESDLFYSSFSDGEACPSQAEWLYKLQDLERRLTVAREALDSITHDMGATPAIHQLCTESLTQTAPKP